jgi:hypothetical protein
MSVSANVGSAVQGDFVAKLEDLANIAVGAYSISKWCLAPIVSLRGSGQKCGV